MFISDSQDSREYIIESDATSIGSDEANALVLKGEGVAPFHSEIRKEDARYILHATDEEASTYVNAIRTEECELTDGDQIQIGAHIFLFQSELDNEKAGAPPANVFDAEKTIAQLDDAPLAEPRGKLTVFQAGSLVNELYLYDEPVFLGREDTNQLVLPDKNISRRHAKVLPVESGYAVIDLDSSNGTFVNRRRIYERTALESNDEIRVGGYDVLFQMLDQAVSGERTVVADEAIEDENTIAVETEEELQAVIERQYPKLIVISENNYGTEYELRESFMTIGRARGNHIVIADDSISREHAALRISGEKVKVDDMGSTNGILVNGQQKESAVLNPNDVLTVGDIHLQYAAPGAAFQLRDAGDTVDLTDQDKSRRKKKLSSSMPKLLIFAALIVVAAGFIGAALFRYIGGPSGGSSRNTSGKSGLSLSESKNAVIDPEAANINLYQTMTQGRQFLDQYQWNAAIQEFDKVLAAQPDNAEAVELRNNAVAEKEYLQKLDFAIARFDSGQDNAARELFEVIPEKSVYYSRAREYIESMNESAAAEYLDSGLALMRRGNYGQAVNRFDAALDIDPGNQEALSARRRALQALNAPQIEKPKRDPGALRRKAEALVDQAINAYVEGEPEKAENRLNGVMALDLNPGDQIVREAQTLLSRIKQVKSHFQAGKNAFQRNENEKGLNDYLNVIEIDRQITDKKNSYYYTEVKGTAVEELLNQGRAYEDSQQFCKAFRNYREILKIDPDNWKAEKYIEAIEKKAIDIYRVGYSQQDFNPRLTASRYKEVMNLLCPEHEYYKKAQQGIEEIMNR